MPDQTFGGDGDGSSGAAPKKKPVLQKYGLSPDANIRDVFWDIMGSYAATRKPSRPLSELDNDRFSLMRVAVSVLDNPQSSHYGLSPGFVAKYSLMMLIDAKWEDALAEFLEECRDSRASSDRQLVLALRHLLKDEQYREQITGQFRKLLRSRDMASTALGYASVLGSRELASELKREAVILARGDVGENQMNAIRVLSLLSEEEEVRDTLLVLLSHWDAEVRKLSAGLLLARKDDGKVRAAAIKRLALETNEDVRSALEKMAKAPGQARQRE